MSSEDWAEHGDGVVPESAAHRPADVIVAPDVSMFEPTAFTRTSDMADIGDQATMETLPQIREILNKLDGELFG